MTRREKITFVAIRSLGNFLLLMSLYGVGAIFGPALMQEVRFRTDAAKGITYIVPSTIVPEKIPGAEVQSPGLPKINTDAKNRILIPPDTQFSLLIPKIGASTKVVANVDPTNEAEFKKVLQTAIAHAKGTVFPGMKGNTYLFAHSTDNWTNVGRYNAVFYLLKDVEVGDEIIVFFENKRFTYKISGKYISEPSQVHLLTESRGDTEQLVLQTCWPPGTTWKRLFILASPVKSLPQTVK